MRFGITIGMFLLVGLINAQSLDFFKSLMDQDMESNLILLGENGFTLEGTKDNSADCKGYSLSTDSISLMFNICKYSDFDQFNLSVIDLDLKSTVDRLNEAKKDAIVPATVSTIGASTSFLFKEGGTEICFVFDHVVGIFITSISNTPHFDSMKESVERQSNFDPDQHGISHFRNILNATNQKGKSIESLIENSGIRTDFSVLEVDDLGQWLIEFKKTTKYEELKSKIDSDFLSDPDYCKHIMRSFFAMQLWLSNPEKHFNFEESKLIQIAIENEKYVFMVMVEYIFTKIWLIQN